MKTRIFKSLIAGAVLLVSAPALCAPENTAWFNIDRLEASTGSANGYRVYASSYAMPLQGCEKSDFAEVQKDLSIADTDLLNRTLLAAFMTGRKVQLRLDGCGTTKRPAYRIVRVDAQ